MANIASYMMRSLNNASSTGHRQTNSRRNGAVCCKFGIIAVIYERLTLKLGIINIIKRAERLRRHDGI